MVIASLLVKQCKATATAAAAVHPPSQGFIFSIILLSVGAFPHFLLSLFLASSCVALVFFLFLLADHV